MKRKKNTHTHAAFKERDYYILKGKIIGGLVETSQIESIDLKKKTLSCKNGDTKTILVSEIYPTEVLVESNTETFFYKSGATRFAISVEGDDSFIPPVFPKEEISKDDVMFLNKVMSRIQKLDEHYKNKKPGPSLRNFSGLTSDTTRKKNQKMV
jgi:hypothetical protein